MSAEQFLYMTSTGWKSGKSHEIEIWYVEYEGCYYIVAEHRERAHWVQNVEHNPVISVRVGEVQFEGRGRSIRPETEPDKAAAITALMDAKYGWSDGLIVELCPEA